MSEATYLARAPTPASASCFRIFSHSIVVKELTAVRTYVALARACAGETPAPHFSDLGKFCRLLEDLYEHVTG